MIITLLLNIAYYLVSAILFFFPLGDGFPSEVIDAFTYFGQQTTMIQPIFPFDTLATVLGLTFLLEASIFGFKALRWIISHIPWIGGH